MTVEITALGPHPAGGKGSVDSAAVCHFCAEVSALQKLQPKAKVDSRVNPVSLGSRRCKVGN